MEYKVVPFDLLQVAGLYHSVAPNPDAASSIILRMASRLSFAKFPLREQVYGQPIALGSEACRKFKVTDVIG